MHAGDDRRLVSGLSGQRTWIAAHPRPALPVAARCRARGDVVADPDGFGADVRRRRTNAGEIPRLAQDSCETVEIPDAPLIRRNRQQHRLRRGAVGLIVMKCQAGRLPPARHDLHPLVDQQAGQRLVEPERRRTACTRRATAARRGSSGLRRPGAPPTDRMRCTEADRPSTTVTRRLRSSPRTSSPHRAALPPRGHRPRAGTRSPPRADRCPAGQGSHRTPR